jgi:hypothetical protein
VACELDVVLREEIMACQQARADFLRWKLILVAGAGAAGIGMLQAEIDPAPVLLALIPPICAYVDAVCLHNDSRIMMIALFMRESPLVSEAARAYETLCQDNRDRFYSEWAVLFLSSAGLSLLVLGIGLLAGYWPAKVAALKVAHPVEQVLMTSGLLGLLATIYLVRRHGQLHRRSREAPSMPRPRAAVGPPPAAGPQPPPAARTE